MTKKDYVAIAAVLNNFAVPSQYTVQQSDVVQAIADRLADVFQRDNPRLDRSRFLAACGVQS